MFDMNWDRYKPICVQGVIPKRKGKLNQISFNPSHPIIIGNALFYILHALDFQ